MELPPIVSEEEWQRSREELLAREKQATRARDALAAERRRQPMLEFSPDTSSRGPTARSGCSTCSRGEGSCSSTTSGSRRAVSRAAAARCSPTRSASSPT